MPNCGSDVDGRIPETTSTRTRRRVADAYDGGVTADGVHPAARAGYTAGAAAYERGRPAYPAKAIAWLIAGLGLRPGDEVLELGAGTGKFTRLLVEAGLRVAAVEPVAAMREHLASLGPAVRPLDAAAEALPLDDASLPGAVAATSLHWTDVPRALAELDRVLAPGAGVGLIWNLRDTTVGWQRDLDALFRRYRGDVPSSRDGRWQAAVDASPTWRIAAEERWRWTLETDVRGVLDRVGSVSFIARLAARELAAVEAQVRAILADAFVATDDGSRIAFPYVSEAYLLRREG
jgi:SAM-dependent methyltransferase